MKVNLQNIRKDQKTSVCNQDIEIFSRPMLPLQKLEEKQNKTKQKTRKLQELCFWNQQLWMQSYEWMR